MVIEILRVSRILLEKVTGKAVKALDPVAKRDVGELDHFGKIVDDTPDDLPSDLRREREDVEDLEDDRAA
jgi:hypothetical protein